MSDRNPPAAPDPTTTPPTPSGATPPELDSTDVTISTTSRKKPGAVREIIETVLLAVLIFFVVRAFVLNFKVEGRSMTPSFQNGELLLVNRNAYRELSWWDLVDWIPFVGDHDGAEIVDFGSPQRGDVIVFTPPAPGQPKPYIKRVIGVAGDTVEIRDNHVFINGHQLDETAYLRPNETTNGCRQYCGPLVVPDHAVFVLGDNRNNSEDSRYFGIVNEDRIIGKAWIVYWPIGNWRVVPHENHPELGS